MVTSRQAVPAPKENKNSDSDITRPVNARARWALAACKGERQHEGGPAGQHLHYHEIRIVDESAELVRNRWISDLHWVREGQQERSQRTQEALLDAAEALFSDKGADATSVADVAGRAGCSVGAFYHHFRDKKALRYALFNRMSEYFTATTRRAVDPSRWEGASVADIVQGYLEFLLIAGRERPAFKRAGLEASSNDPELLGHLEDLHRQLNKGLRALLMARRGEIGHPRPKVAIGFVLDQIASMTKTRLDQVLLPTELANISDDRFVAEAVRSAVAYLQVAPPQD